MRAGGSFGALPDGPLILAAFADDPDDGDATPGVLSPGDTILITFDMLTTTPDLADPASLLVFYRTNTPDGSAVEVDLGSFAGEWGSHENTTLLLTLTQLATSAVGAPPLTHLAVRCRANTNLTRPSTATGAPTSLPCGHTRAAGPPTSAAGATPLSGDFGAAPPYITSVTARDPDNADAVYGPGDVLTITFSGATDMGGYAVGATVPRDVIARWFTFSPALPDGANFTGVWPTPNTLNITFVSVGPYPPVDGTAPTALGCTCLASSPTRNGSNITSVSGGGSALANASTNGTDGFGNPYPLSPPMAPPPAPSPPERCRGSEGIHLLGLTSSVDLLCPEGLVDLSAGSSWGSHPGPNIVSVTAEDDDDNDAVFGNDDTIDIAFEAPTNMGGLTLGVTYLKDVVTGPSGLFEFSRNFGREFTGTWITNATFRIRIVDKQGADISSTSSLLRVECNPATAYPIYDASLLYLQSTCLSLTIGGSFGALESPALTAAVAEDADNADGILSTGDTITITWASDTDRGWTLLEGETPCNENTPPVAVPTEYLEGVDQLVAFFLPSPPAPPTSALPPAVPLSLSGVWSDCATLTLTVGRTPDASEGGGPAGPIQIGSGLFAYISGSGGERGDGVRNPISASVVSTGSLPVTGSYGERPGPTLAAARADDADDDDAIFSVGDTLTLTFSQPTDMGGYASGVTLPAAWVDGLLEGPAAPPGTWQATWADASTLVLTVISVAATDVRIHGPRTAAPCTTSLLL